MFNGDDDNDDEDEDMLPELLINAKQGSGLDANTSLFEVKLLKLLLSTISERGRELKLIAGEFGILDAGELLDDPYAEYDSYGFIDGKYWLVC